MLINRRLVHDEEQGKLIFNLGGYRCVVTASNDSRKLGKAWDSSQRELEVQCTLTLLRVRHCLAKVRIAILSTC